MSIELIPFIIAGVLAGVFVLLLCGSIISCNHKAAKEAILEASRRKALEQPEEPFKEFSNNSSEGTVPNEEEGGGK